jgi:aspartyl protease family protein
MQRLLLLVFASIFVMFGAGWGIQRVMTGDRSTAPAETREITMDKQEADAVQGHTEIRRDDSGQFHVSGQVNGEDVRFLVDTGADVVALTVDDAARLGIDADPASFEPIMQTASGTANGMRINIERLAVAGGEYENVDAVVVEGLSVNLLGQSALRQMGRVELQGDKLVIDRQT